MRYLTIFAEIFVQFKVKMPIRSVVIYSCMRGINIFSIYFLQNIINSIAFVVTNVVIPYHMPPSTQEHKLKNTYRHIYQQFTYKQNAYNLHCDIFLSKENSILQFEVEIIM